MASGSKQNNKRQIEKRSVSAPSDLLEQADKTMARRHISNFSEYVRDLIRRDLEGQPRPEEAAA